MKPLPSPNSFRSIIEITPEKLNDLMLYKQPWMPSRCVDMLQNKLMERKKNTKSLTFM